MDLLFPAAGAEWDAEPPHVPARPPGGHCVCVQPDHSGPGRGHACQPAHLHCHPAVVRHEDLPQPPAGAGLCLRLQLHDDIMQLHNSKM